MQPAQDFLRIGIDIGGTFTDFVICDPLEKTVRSFKLASTPADPSSAVIEGLRLIQHELSSALPRALTIIHGSTVATNALLERKGVKTALVTTEGFRDVIFIGRQNRPNIYELFVTQAAPLIERGSCFEISERMDKTGAILQPLDSQQITQLTNLISDSQYESIAVTFLFSFANPAHEQQISGALKNLGVFVSASHEVLPEFREYERTSTTLINAYVSPILDKYLANLEKHKPNQSNLLIMQSNGGVISASQARKFGVRCILSGPAGGISGAMIVARSMEKSAPASVQIMTFDMGGTSTDVALVIGEPSLTTATAIDGYPIGIPALDIHTIGAGGGSIASLDKGGALRVGPESAGANPGPACYGLGSFATITDANLVTGRLLPEFFLGGRIPLYKDRSFAACSHLASQVHLSTEELAASMIDVVNAHMERALRLVSIQRGHDPRQFKLISFGGAGGLHAADLARQIGIPTVVIPKFAATLSAYGMLFSDLIKDYSKTVMLPGSISVEQLSTAYDPLVAQALEDFSTEGITVHAVSIHRSLDVRYRGQSFELNIPYSSGDLCATFESIYLSEYGYTKYNSAIEIVNVRLRAVASAGIPKISPARPGFPARMPPPALTARVYLPVPNPTSGNRNHGWSDIPVFFADTLPFNITTSGPALIVRSDTTILIGAQDAFFQDEYENLVIRIGDNAQ